VFIHWSCGCVDGLMGVVNMGPDLWEVFVVIWKWCHFFLSGAHDHWHMVRAQPSGI
jgi:hypothetical protein